MECVVLAAGEGKRMRPLTARRPKVMLPLANRPMLEHLIMAARDAGVTGFVFVVGMGRGRSGTTFRTDRAGGSGFAMSGSPISGERQMPLPLHGDWYREYSSSSMAT